MIIGLSTLNEETNKSPANLVLITPTLPQFKYLDIFSKKSISLICWVICKVDQILSLLPYVAHLL